MLNNLYYYTSYLRNRGAFIKVRSIIRVWVFFLHPRAEGATKGAIGFQEAALIPAEVENSDKEEQHNERTSQSGEQPAGNYG